MYNQGYANVVKANMNLDLVQDNPYMTDDCYPIYLDKDIKNLRSYYELLQEMTQEYIYVPCRKCPACLKKRSNEWRGRLMNEYLYQKSHGKETLFVTLTYNDKYIHSARSRYRKDLAQLFDRLRSKYRYSIRHWCIPELGEGKGRFHIHALLFAPPDDIKPDYHFRRSKNCQLHGASCVLDRLWPYGFNDVGYLGSVAGANYISSYLTKISDASLKANDGLPFKGGIVCSNKLGFLEYDEKSLFDQARRGDTPVYKIGEFAFTFPQSLTRRLLNPLKLRYISMLNTIKRECSGGQFIFHKQHYPNYGVYRDVVRNVVRNTCYYRAFKTLNSAPSILKENYEYLKEDLF